MRKYIILSSLVLLMAFLMGQSSHDSRVLSDNLTFAENGESINNSTDGTFDFTRNDAGVVTFTCSDNDATAGCTYDAGGASPIVVGSADVTQITLNTDGAALGLDLITNSLTLIATTTATAVFSGADAAGAANTTYDTTGAGAITVGSADVTAVTITTDDTGDGSDLVLPAGSVGSAELDERLCTQVLFSSVDPTEASATDDYLSLADHAGSTTEANEDDFITAAVAGSVNNLGCTVDVAPGVGQDPWLMTVRVGAAGALANTDVTCTIDEAATTCTDVANDAPFAARDSITVSISSAGPDADPAAAALMQCSLCLGPE